MSRRGVRVFAAWVVLTGGASALAGAPAALGPGPVWWIPIEDGPQVARGMIDPWLSFFVARHAKAAKDAGASAIVLAIRSNGGSVDSSMEISYTLRRAAPTPTIAFVVDRAFSGAAYIALSCDRIYMEAGSRMGAAQVVMLDPTGGMKPVGEKGDSPMRSSFRALAQEKGRNPALAEAMVDPDKVVLRVDVSGEETFVLEDELAEFEREMERAGRKVRVLDTVVQAGELLTMTAKDALERFRFIDGVVRDRAELLALLGKSESDVVEVRTSWPQEVARFLGGMAVSGILISIAMLGLMMELWAPGKGIGGLVFLFAMGLFFWAHILGGQAGAVEVVLFLLGVVLLGIEAFVIPGFGVVGFTGIGLVVVSLILSFLPGSSLTGAGEGIPFPWESLRGALFTVFAALGATGVVVMIVARHLPRVPVFKRLVLEAPGPEQGARAAADGFVALVGRRGVAHTDLRPAGKIEIDGRLLDAVTEAEFLPLGEGVEVVEASGLRLVVRRAPPPTPGKKEPS